jgi:pimeloyl-ACP methyl ester carboxylesterase
MNGKRAFNIVLVHGGFIDGSSWEPVYHLLRHEGFAVTVVQNSTASLQGDVAITTHALQLLERPSLLVGHSYGGVVITEAGNYPNVIGLVYVAAFVPDVGESVQRLLSAPVPGAPTPPILPARDGDVFLDKAQFRAAYAADLDVEKAEFLADAQVPWGVDALAGTIKQAAWRKKTSWYLVSTEDRMIPPVAQRFMAKRAGALTSEATGSHSIVLSHPDAVAALITTAAESKSMAA